MDAEEDLVEVPLIPRPRASTAQLIGIDLTEFSAPIPYRFIGQKDAAFGHQLSDVAIARAKANVEPHTVADNLCWEPMALIQVAWWRCGHAASMACGVEAGQVGRLI
jgi:hypothetical protein